MCQDYIRVKNAKLLVLRKSLSLSYLKYIFTHLYIELSVSITHKYMSDSS